MSEPFAFAALWLALAVAVFWIARREADLAAERRARRAVERWIRDELLRIRVGVVGSEEGDCVAQTLLRALPALAPVDVDGLDKQLYQLRSAARARIMRACGATGKARP